ncbi:hypothetical protein DPMN_067436 [Dreissena polymorpha]|uniref:Uncharacterized protein n=1 Tax=Dreissena polymorpha TaxID=45954 RepID=A0A9D3Z092_DREPO|nr:hypothetical protein DPMN_067436 [Dreissena polymorpha]
MGVILRVIYCCHSRLAVMNDVMNDGVILRVIYCGHIRLAVMNDGLILRAIYCGHSRLSEMKDGAIFSVIYCGHIRLLHFLRGFKINKLYGNANCAIDIPISSLLCRRPSKTTTPLSPLESDLSPT